MIGIDWILILLRRSGRLERSQYQGEVRASGISKEWTFSAEGEGNSRGKKKACDYTLGTDEIEHHGQMSFDVVVSVLLSTSLTCLLMSIDEHLVLDMLHTVPNSLIGETSLCYEVSSSSLPFSRSSGRLLQSFHHSSVFFDQRLLNASTKASSPQHFSSSLIKNIQCCSDPRQIFLPKRLDCNFWPPSLRHRNDRYSHPKVHPNWVTPTARAIRPIFPDRFESRIP